MYVLYILSSLKESLNNLAKHSRLANGYHYKVYGKECIQNSL